MNSAPYTGIGCPFPWGIRTVLEQGSRWEVQPLLPAHHSWALPLSRENISLTAEINTSNNDLDALMLLKWKIWRNFALSTFLTLCGFRTHFPPVSWVTAPSLSH